MIVQRASKLNIKCSYHAWFRRREIFAQWFLFFFFSEVWRAKDLTYRPSFGNLWCHDKRRSVSLNTSNNIPFTDFEGWLPVLWNRVYIAREGALVPPKTLKPKRDKINHICFQFWNFETQASSMIDWTSSMEVGWSTSETNLSLSLS